VNDTDAVLRERAEERLRRFRICMDCFHPYGSCMSDVEIRLLGLLMEKVGLDQHTAAKAACVAASALLDGSPS